MFSIVLTSQVGDEVTVFLASEPIADMPKARVGWSYRIVTPAKLWSLWRLPLDLYVGKLGGRAFDVFYSLGHYAPRFCPFPSVISVMDVAYLKFPEFFKKSDVWKLTLWTAYSARNAAHIITISDHTKRDIIEYYKKTEDQITVAYPGMTKVELIGTPTRALQKLRIKQPYIVYIGTIQPRKNLIRLIKAFELVIAKHHHQSLQLVIAGKVGWFADEFVRVTQHSSAKKNIHVVGFVTDEEKFALYKQAVAAVLVGLYEGFGIPPLEAISAGTIPIVSETASLPEVVGPGGVLVDPYSVDDIARGILEVLEYKDREREHMIEEGRRYAEKFSWEQSAQKVLDVLHRIGGV